MNSDSPRACLDGAVREYIASIGDGCDRVRLERKFQTAIGAIPRYCTDQRFRHVSLEQPWKRWNREPRDTIGVSRGNYYPITQEQTKRTYSILAEKVIAAKRAMEENHANGFKACLDAEGFAALVEDAVREACCDWRRTFGEE